MSDSIQLLESLSTRLNDSKFFPDEDFIGMIEFLKVEGLNTKLRTEIKNFKNPSKAEVRMLVNLYYQMQDMRKAIREQIRSIEQNEKKKLNIEILDYFLKSISVVELNCKNILNYMSQQSELGRWLMSIVGIGPVLAAGCIAYFDIKDKQYATQFISYAGLNDNNRPWIGKKGAEAIMKEITSNSYLTDEEVIEFSIRTQWGLDYLRSKAYVKNKWKRDKLIAAAAKVPYNKELKTLCWKIGKSFMFLANNKKSLYGSLYAQRRVLETQRNEAGMYADQASEILRTKNFSKDTDAYKAYIKGRLPEAHIISRSMRWTEKIFICHLFECMYRIYHKDDPNGNIPPKYYVLEHMGHHDYIPPEVPYPY